MSKIKWFGPVVAVVLLALAMGSPALSAKGKPGGGGGEEPLAGTVYFKVKGLLYTMDPDGSNKTPLPPDVFGEPSRELHGGHRWFVQWDYTGPFDSGTGDPLPFYPDGTARRELFAVRADGDVLFEVQLTDDPKMKIGNNTVLRWAVDPVVGSPVVDGTVSWAAVRWDLAGEEIAEAGIYQMPILFDEDGNVDPLSTFAGPTLVVPGGWDDSSASTQGIQPDLTRHDWAPDGTQIVYNVRPDPQTYILVIEDLLLNESRFLVEGVHSAWSPDGTKIAFFAFQSGTRSTTYTLETINVDGTSRKTLVSVRSKLGEIDGVRDPAWAPTSSHLVYTRIDSVKSSGATFFDVYRVKADGSSNTDLTGDVTDWATWATWR